MTVPFCMILAVYGGKDWKPMFTICETVSSEPADDEDDIIINK